MKSLLLIVFVSFNAYSYVENVSHGYPNCMACHVSPSGGGVLNDYGRALSGELMSAWTIRGAEQPLMGLVNNRENLKIGGDIRYAQVHSENKNRKRGRQFLMQQNIELAIKHKDFWFVGTLGTQEGPREVEETGTFLSERHYVMFEASESHRVRAGKFRKNFGLGDPNHTRLTKSNYGFGSQSETYQLEATQYFEWGEAVLFADLGRLDIPRSQNERGFGGTVTHYLNGKSRIGIMGMIAESVAQRRELLGVHLVQTLPKHLLLKGEIISQKSFQSSDANVSNHSLGGQYTLSSLAIKGLWPYLVFEHNQANTDDSDTLVTAPGAGIMLLPFPHFDIQAEYQHRMNRSEPGNPDKRAWVVAHFYL